MILDFLLSRLLAGSPKMLVAFWGALAEGGSIRGPRKISWIFGVLLASSATD